jgi:hypothetical protein
MSEEKEKEEENGMNCSNLAKETFSSSLKR